MKCRSKKNPLSALPEYKGFSLPEVVAALIILALVSSSVLVVINRCMVSAADSALRMRAFEVARENMEALLSSDSVKEMVEYGSSDKYPGIEWQTVVEAFYEPITARMWIQAVCSAEYTDVEGEVQTVELTNWLTNVSKEDVRKILEEQQKEEERLAEQIIETEEEAADYAGVDEQTIQQWVENGMLKTEDGKFIKRELDLYKQTDGNPTIEDRKKWELAKGGGSGPSGGKPVSKPDDDIPETDEPDGPGVLSPKEECMRRLKGITTQEEFGIWFAECWSVVTN